MAAQFSSKHIVTSRLAALLVSLAMLAGQGAVTQASADVSLVRSGYTHEALFGIVLEGDHGYAVGMPGLVLRTADQGKTWQPEDMINNGLALLAVTMSGDHAITVGQGGHIFKRTGKAAWTQVESGSKERLLAVDMNASGLAVAAGGFGTILLSHDYGATWASVAPSWAGIGKDDAEPHINDVKISASGTITIVGEFGLVMRSQNEGRDWSILHRGEETLFGLFMTKDGHGAAAGQDGTVLISDGWTSDWREVATGRPENLLDIWVGEDGRMVATGIRTLLISNNWGSNWAVVDRKDIATGWYEGVAASGDGPQAVPLAVGYDARILKVGK
tara:strand:- start:826 stop:1818 length:993 start_codon:yes stop_codon:yes gene_type:complete